MPNKKKQPSDLDKVRAALMTDIALPQTAQALDISFRQLKNLRDGISSNPRYNTLLRLKQFYLIK